MVTGIGCKEVRFGTQRNKLFSGNIYASFGAYDRIKLRLMRGVEHLRKFRAVQIEHIEQNVENHQQGADDIRDSPEC